MACGGQGVGLRDIRIENRNKDHVSGTVGVIVAGDVGLRISTRDVVLVLQPCYQTNSELAGLGCA